MTSTAMGRPGARRAMLTTRPILQNFVSSHKSDVFKCHSIAADTYLTPPYACAYTNGAKQGGKPLLAIATEQGSVHIIDTSKRRDWDYEPQRTTLQPHDNGTFDIKWNHNDTLLASVSGDLTTQISCVESQRSLYALNGHTSTVKCVVWDPEHRELLSTGGRDGVIHVWDLRTESARRNHNDVPTLTPVLRIADAHEEGPKGKVRKKKSTAANRTVTSLTYAAGQPYNLISSGSNDGILRLWDLRAPLARKQPPANLKYTNATSIDPTTFNGSRPRGIVSVSQGTGPTAGLLFALAADSRIHPYSAHASLDPFTSQIYEHENMKTNSFYVRVATSPCGRWLASGAAAAGSVFLYDISNAARAARDTSPPARGVQLAGQTGEVAALDWADGMLATCADDGTVRVWRADEEVYSRCRKDPEESKWEWAFSARA
ncbi:WD40 repeat-like protein [Athelia psychrophila]|uniref:WD40 repeat-like protein n=1 Tax=Athelia psychrophila TaxID=1759441 RepID=A0A166AY65_9AGAM|nr:WD40 repeat-like protein [Fibularhizoctonia sp. CBS 109695]